MAEEKRQEGRRSNNREGKIEGVIVKWWVWEHDYAAFLWRSKVSSSIRSINFTPLMTSANRVNPRSFRTVFNQKAPPTPLQGCGALIFSLTRLFNHSVKIGHIPIYIGIERDFILYELNIRWSLSFHNNLRSKYWWVMIWSIFHKNLQCKDWWLTNGSILQHPSVNAKNNPLKIGVTHNELR